MQTTHSCGDLVFSSHTTFALVGCLTYNEYGSTIITKAGACASSALHEQHNHGLECCRISCVGPP